MNRKSQDPLERWTQGVLDQWPQKRAPATLAARVLEQIRQQAAQAAARPWHQSPWLGWPMKLRVASAIVFLIVLAGGCFLAHAAEAGVAGAAEQFHYFAVAGNAVVALGRALGHAASHFNPVVWTFMVICVAVAWMMTWGLGAACVRLAEAKR